MTLDDSTRDDVARFFVRRFPLHTDLTTVASRAGLEVPGAGGPGEVEPLAAWRALIVDAEQRGALGRLAQAAEGMAPGDRNLREMMSIFVAPGAPPPAQMRFGPVVIGLLAFLAGVGVTTAWQGTRGPAPKVATVATVVREEGTTKTVGTPSPTDEAPGTPAAEDVGEASGAETSSVKTGEASGAETRSAEPAGGAGDAKTMGPAPSPAATVPAGPRATVPDLPLPGTAGAPPLLPRTEADPKKAAEAKKTAEAKPAVTASAVPVETGATSIPPGCRANAGALVGYWYAGTTAPGAQGATITVPGRINVRSDYPRVENEFSKTAPIRCTLPAGIKQRLTKAPIEAQGTFWVPVVEGDLGGT